MAFNLRAIIPFIQLILAKSLNENEFANIRLASWPVEGSNPCFVHCQAKEGKLPDVWRFVSNMPRLRTR